MVIKICKNNVKISLNSLQERAISREINPLLEKVFSILKHNVRYKLSAISGY
jgi:hypothetical protein